MFNSLNVCLILATLICVVYPLPTEAPKDPCVQSVKLSIGSAAKPNKFDVGKDINLTCSYKAKPNAEELKVIFTKNEYYQFYDISNRYGKIFSPTKGIESVDVTNSTGIVSLVINNPSKQTVAYYQCSVFCNNATGSIFRSNSDDILMEMNIISK